MQAAFRKPCATSARSCIVDGGEARTTLNATQTRTQVGALGTGTCRMVAPGSGRPGRGWGWGALGAEGAPPTHGPCFVHAVDTCPSTQNSLCPARTLCYQQAGAPMDLSVWPEGKAQPTAHILTAPWVTGPL